MRDLLQASFKQYRDTAVKNACFFAVFFGLFLLMTFQVYNIHIAFSTDDAVIDLFLDEEMDDYNFKFNFGEVRQSKPRISVPPSHPNHNLALLHR